MTEPRRYDFRKGHQDPDAKHLDLRQGAPRAGTTTRPPPP